MRQKRTSSVFKKTTRWIMELTYDCRRIEERQMFIAFLHNEIVDAFKVDDGIMVNEQIIESKKGCCWSGAGCN